MALRGRNDAGCSRAARSHGRAPPQADSHQSIPQRDCGHFIADRPHVDPAAVAEDAFNLAVGSC